MGEMEPGQGKGAHGCDPDALRPGLPSLSITEHFPLALTSVRLEIVCIPSSVSLQ